MCAELMWQYFFKVQMGYSELWKDGSKALIFFYINDMLRIYSVSLIETYCLQITVIKNPNLVSTKLVLKIVVLALKRTFCMKSKYEN